VLAGDYNVAPTGLDIYPTKSWDKDALIQPKSRAAFESLLAQGWCDAKNRSTPSGITSETAGRATRACGSITSC